MLSGGVLPTRMTTTKNICDLNDSEPSLCIPRVFPNITDERVRTVLNELNFGTINRIDMVPRETMNGEFYQRVFVHFKEWDKSEATSHVRQKMVNGEEIKVVYDDPWYWKVSASRGKKQRAHGDAPKPRIVFQDPLNKTLSVEVAKDLSAMMDDAWSRPPPPTKLNLTRERFGDGVSNEPKTPPMSKSWADIVQEEDDKKSDGCTQVRAHTRFEYVDGEK
tara:strand:- start:8 stop:667 length:660 start_codon:yes stop_codon:yes gene_type:complete